VSGTPDAGLTDEAYDLGIGFLELADGDLDHWHTARRWLSFAARRGHPDAPAALARMDALTAELDGIDAGGILGDHLLDREPPP